MMQLQALNARLPDPGHVRKNRCLEKKKDKHASLSQLFSIFPCFPMFFLLLFKPFSKEIRWDRAMQSLSL